MTRCAAVPVLAGLVGLSAIGCGGAEAVPFEPRKIQLQQLDAADQVIYPRPTPMSDMARTEQGFLDVRAATEQESSRTDRDNAMELLMPTTSPAGDATTQPTTAPGKVDTVEMSLREAIGKTVIYNYDVSVAAYQPAIEETRVVEAEARFDTIFRQSLEYQRTENEIGGIQSFGGIVTEDTQESVRAETSLQKLLSSGGQAELTFQQTYLDSETAVVTGQTLLNPTFETSLTLRFTQPLLRDFGPTVNRARIVINQNNQRIGVLDFREQLETSLLETEEIFWQLYVAREGVTIQRELLEQSMETAERIKNRLGQEISSVSSSEVSSCSRKSSTPIRWL
ncbi:MAG: TolC family protein, partial [Planctomycetota bacterium]